MAHFCKLGIGNIVERVEVVSNDIATTEQAGVDFLNNLYNTRDVWKQTYKTFRICISALLLMLLCSQSFNIVVDKIYGI